MDERRQLERLLDEIERSLTQGKGELQTLREQQTAQSVTIERQRASGADGPWVRAVQQLGGLRRRAAEVADRLRELVARKRYLEARLSQLLAAAEAHEASREAQAHDDFANFRSDDG